MKDWRNEMQVLPIGKGKKLVVTGMISPYFLSDRSETR
mgnify:CR=1 FL=1